RSRNQQLLVFDVGNLTLARVVQISNPFDLCSAVASNTTNNDPGKLFDCHLMNPRFEPPIKLTRCATCSSSTWANWSKTSATGIFDLNSILYAFFNARRASSENPARCNPTLLTPRTCAGLPSVMKNGSTS